MIIKSLTGIIFRRTIVLGLAALLILTAAGAGAETRDPRWAQPLQLEKSDNFHRVTSRLYRSAQPSTEAFREYRRFGIRTVINLRANHSDRKKIHHTGLRLFEVPINTWSLGDEEVITALGLIKNEPGPILIHCQHGADRTGTVVAMYRIIFQGWSRQEALREMTEGGYGYHSVWTNLPKYILRADLNKIRLALGCPPSGPCETAAP